MNTELRAESSSLEKSNTCHLKVGHLNNVLAQRRGQHTSRRVVREQCRSFQLIGAFIEKIS